MQRHNLQQYHSYLFIAIVSNHIRVESTRDTVIEHDLKMVRDRYRMKTREKSVGPTTYVIQPPRIKY